MTISSILWTHPNQPGSILGSDVAQDLNFDQVVSTIVAGREQYPLTDNFYRLTGDVMEIVRRQDVMRDLDGSVLLEIVQRFAEQMRSVRQRQSQATKIYYRRHQEMFLLSTIRQYVDTIESLRIGLDATPLTSTFLSEFRNRLDQYVDSSSFRQLCTETAVLQAAMLSIQYNLMIQGGNVRVFHVDDEPAYDGEIRAALKRFRNDDAPWNNQSTSVGADQMNHVEAKILDLVAELFPEPFAHLTQYCDQYQDYSDELVDTFENEIQFYLAYRDYTQMFSQHDLRFCYPEVFEGKGPAVNHQGYDLALAYRLLNGAKKVTVNDFELDAAERILVVTGPNQGGKTTFARTFGQIHWLANLGLPVPGDTARLGLVRNLFTHFEREERLTDPTGKLQAALVRIHDILRDADHTSIIIMNEIFNGTTSEDATFLMKEILRRVVDLDCTAVLVTFMDEMATFHAETTVSLVATVDADHQPTFRVMRGPARGVSDAVAIAKRYGLSYDQVRGRIRS